MRNTIAFPHGAAQVRREAAAWLARLDGEELLEQELCDLRAWLAADARHVQALVKMAQLWDAMDSMKVLAEMFPVAAPPPRHSTWQWLYGYGAAAIMASLIAAVALLTVVLPGALTTPGHSSQSEPQELVYRTGIGEQSEVSLRDGSVLTLNTGSEVRVRYEKRERAVFLTSGEAYFDVAKNPKVPFVVYAGRGQVRALGTAFSVRLEGGLIEVLVDEGTVQVDVVPLKRSSLVTTSRGVVVADAQDSVTLREGGKVGYADTLDGPDYLTRESLQQRLAWRTGKWVFTGETLSEVVGEVSRYTHKRIEIVDPAIANLRIGGYFDIGEIDAFLTVLQSGFGVSVTSVNDELIQLSALDPRVSSPQ